MKPKKTNVYAIDVLRTIAILAVVLIHTSSRTLEFFHYDLINFPLTLFLNQLSRFAVPLFFLISGFVLELNYDSNRNYWEYLKKRFGKILIPYLFWSGVYYFLVFKVNPDSFFKVILTGSASYQLYFIPSLLIFYLLFPLLHKVIKQISNIYVLFFLGGIEMAILYQEYHVKNLSIPFPIAVSLFNFYVFYLGMIASRNYEKILSFISKVKYLMLSSVPLLAGYVFWQGKSNYYKTFNIDAFYSQWRPSVLVYTLVTGAVLFYLFNKSSGESKFIKTLSKLSFLVFFIHTLILEYAWRLLGPGWKMWYDLPFFTIVSLASFLIAYLIHRIPFLSKVTG